MDEVHTYRGQFGPRLPEDKSKFSKAWQALDFFIPVIKPQSGYIRRMLKRSGLAIAFSSATIYPLNIGELVAGNAEYNGLINCSVPDDVIEAFLYTTNDPADLDVEQPESPYNGRIEMLSFEQQDREIDGFGDPNTQIVGACYLLVDGEHHYWVDAFHESVAGTREQLSNPEYASVNPDGYDSESGFQITLPAPSP